MGKSPENKSGDQNCNKQCFGTVEKERLNLSVTEAILEESDYEPVDDYEVSEEEGIDLNAEEAILEESDYEPVDAYGVSEDIDLSAEEAILEESDYEPVDACEVSGEEGIDLSKEEAILEESDYEPLDDFEVIKNKEQTEQREQKKVDKFLENGERACVFEIAQRVLKRNRYTYIDSPEGDGAMLYRYDGKIWRQRSDKDLMYDVYQVLTQEEKKQHGAIDNFCKNIKDYIHKEIRMAYDEQKYHFTESDFRKVENRIVFQNGIYDCYTREFLEFDCNLPYIMAVNADYIEYDVSTDIYDNYKAAVTDGDVETQNLIDYMIGYLLIANQNGKCMFCIGPARNTGKSTLGQFIRGCVDGRRVSEINLDNRSNRFILDKAYETAIYMCLEMSTDGLDEKQVALLKRLTGERVIQTEAKNKSAQDISNRSKVLLATNGGIYLKGNQCEPAFYERLIVIPFVRSTPKDEMRGDLFDLLTSERSAILSKVARKLGDIIDSSGKVFFPESEAGSRMKAEWSRSVYGEDRYYEDAIIYTGKLEDRISRSSLYEGYKIYFKINLATEKRAMMLDEKSFESKIKAIEPKIQSKRARCYDELQGREKNVMVYHGLKWNQEWLEIFQREYQSNSNS